MKTLLWFFKAWLLACFGLAFFVVPMYLIAIYPEVPEPYYRVARIIGHGVVRGESSALGFWYRLTSCGILVLLGTLMVWIWLRDVGRSSSRDEDLGDAT